MTISSETRKAGPFNGNGVTTSFPFTFKAFSEADVQVIYTNTSSVETVLVLDSDYTIALNEDQNANPGGTVSYSTLITGEKITLLGNVEYTQETDIQNQGGFYPEVIENALDKLTMQVQQVNEKANRSVQVPISSSTPPGDYLTTVNAYKIAAETSASSAATSATNAAISAAAAISTPVAAPTHASPLKGTPADADEFPILDSTLSFSLGRLSWGTLKSTILSIVSGFYALKGANSDITSLTGLTTPLSVLQGGTGLSTSPTVNVKSFGATGNGVTDDRAAIQSAIDSLTSGTVVFPPGSYVINTNGSGVGLTLKPNVSLVAEGTSVYLLAGSNSIKLLNYLNPNPSTLVSNFTIRGINLLANGKTGCEAIKIDGNVSAARCSVIRLSDFMISGAFTGGVGLVYCANSFISDLFISGCVNGVSLLNCADTDIIGVKVQSGSGGGFVFTGGAGAFDEGTRLTSCSTNGQVIGLSITGQDWGIVTGCSFTTCSGGSVITAGACVNWKFTNCEFACGVTPNTGVALSSASSKFSFTGCLFSNNTFGIVLGGTFHTVSACLFDANTNIDLYLSSTSKVNVTGNIFNSTGSTFSVYEITANYSNVIANQMNGTITLVGAQSIQANNILY